MRVLGSWFGYGFDGHGMNIFAKRKMRFSWRWRNLREFRQSPYEKTLAWRESMADLILASRHRDT